MKIFIITLILISLLVLPSIANAITVDTTLTTTLDLGYTGYCYTTFGCTLWNIYYINFLLLIILVVLLMILVLKNKKIKKSNKLITNPDQPQQKKISLKILLIIISILVISAITLYILNLQDEEYYKDTGQYKYFN